MTNYTPSSPYSSYQKVRVLYLFLSSPMDQKYRTKLKISSILQETPSRCGMIIPRGPWDWGNPKRAALDGCGFSVREKIPMTKNLDDMF